MTFGEDWGWGATPEDSAKIIGTFLERGGNFIDTANFYTKGHSEKIIGDFIAQDRARRERMVLATKFFGNLYPGDPNGGGAGRKAIVAQCEQSLRRLQTDYIDLYWLHMNDRFTPVEETLRTLDDLVASGKVRYLGFSDTPAWRPAQAQTIAHFRSWAPLISLQIEYSLLERTVEGELIPMAQDMGLGVTPWGPLKSGALSVKYTRENRDEMKSDRGDHVTGSLTDQAYDFLDELQKIARELDSTVAAVSLAWVHSRPGVTSTIIGARTMKQLDSNLAALDLPLSKDHIESLDKLSKDGDAPPARGASPPRYCSAKTLFRKNRITRCRLFVRVNPVLSAFGTLHCSVIHLLLIGLAYLSCAAICLNSFVGRTYAGLRRIHTLCHTSPLSRQMASHSRRLLL
jgi:aryl-alcohol dehydrogenase-like predicted oxidoreductase